MSHPKAKRSTPRVRANFEGKARPQATPIAIEPLAVRTPEGARMLSVGKTKMKELIASGEVESIKLGSARLVLVSSIRKLLGESATP